VKKSKVLNLLVDIFATSLTTNNNKIFLVICDESLTETVRQSSKKQRRNANAKTC